MGDRAVQTPAIVLGGHPAGLAVVRSLSRAGIPVTSVVSSGFEHGGHSRRARTVTAPDPAARARDYVDLLLDLGGPSGGGVVIPTTDESLEAVARHRDELARRYLVASPSYDVAQRFLDKGMTSTLAADIGVLGPRTTAPADEADLERCAGLVGFPCLVKPRESYQYQRAFGVKMTRVDDQHQLRDVWRRARAAGIATLVQELIPGPETAGVNYNVYVVDGDPVVEFTSRKLRLSPPDFGFPSAVVSADVADVVDPGRRLVHALGMEGFANVEFKRDERSGCYILMEINGRPNLSGALAPRCGLDFPLLTYRHLVSGIVPTPVRWATGVYWLDDLSDPRALVTRRRRHESTLRGALTPYASRHAFAYWDARDPGPFVAGARAVMTEQLGRRSRRPGTAR